MAQTKARRMRELLEKGAVVSPGVFDGYSARLVEKMGFQACSSTGAGLANSRLSQPDVGIMTLHENAEACSRFANTISIPMMADADTGYGNAVTFYHTVQYFEQAGVVGVNLEDQVSPKRCGHMRGKAVIDAREMAKKIEAGVKAKKDPDFIINARTDAIAVGGIEGAIRRAKLYLAAGADMVYADAIETEDQMKRFCGAVAPAWVSINMGFGIRSRPTTPTLSVERLAEIGFRRITLARMLPAAAIMGMKRALEIMQESMRTGEVHDRPDLLVGIEEITDLMGYAFINQLETEFSLEKDLQQRYRGERADYVVRGGH
jgi:2-methylisocitrate lyase-like PEP mutase family enzyme